MKIEQTPDAIKQIFYQDCKERILRVTEIVQGGVPLNNAQLDRLHQEFDTLFGGARAVHFPDLEYYFRQMALYARYLRNQQIAGQDRIGQQAWQVLMDGVEALQCGEFFDCIEQCNKKWLLLGQGIEKTINNGVAR
jgi:hypothetical protein